MSASVFEIRRRLFEMAASVFKMTRRLFRMTAFCIQIDAPSISDHHFGIEDHAF